MRSRSAFLAICLVASTLVGVGSTGVASALTVAAPTDLGTLGGTSSTAVAASGNLVVGNSDIAGDAAQHAFVYDRSDPSPHMVDLGTLGGATSTATAVSGSVVVGYSPNPQNQLHAFAYDLADPAPHMIDLAPVDVTFSTALVVGGNIVAGTYRSGNEFSNELRAYYYDLGAPSPQMVDLGGLTTSITLHFAGAAAVVGRVVAGTASTGLGHQHAFVNDLNDPSPHMIDLGTLGGTNSAVTAMSGRVVFGFSDIAGNTTKHGFAYDLSDPTPHMVDLDASIGAGRDDPRAADGSLVVGALNPTTATPHAFVYDSSAASPHVTDIGTLSGGDASNAVDVKGSLVVGLSRTSAGGPFQAFVYDVSAASPHMIELDTLGGASGYPIAVDASGVIAGNSLTATGVNHAAVWQTSPSVDTDAPAITITTPANGSEFTRGQVVNAAYSCDDGPDGSGVATCTGSVANGTPIDTATAGVHSFTVNATDALGNATSTSAGYTVRAGDVSQSVSGGEVVSTDPGGIGASPGVPVQTQIVVPAGLAGQITVAPAASGSPPAGYVFLGAAVALNGPTAPSSADPYLATFTVDASVLGALAPNDLQVFRNSAPVPDCTDASAAIPDPCVYARGAVGGGSDDAFISVRTTQFSTWALGQRAFSVTAVAPSSGARGAVHEVVQIIGTGFVAGSTATFPAGGVTVNSATLVDGSHLAADISITNAAALGVRNVQVKRSGPPVTTAICTGCFTVNAKPAITTVSPNSVPQGAIFEYVTITGTDFVAGAAVTFSGTGLTAESVSGGGTSLLAGVAVSPTAGLGARAVTVTNPDGGTVTKANALTVTANPTATAITPGAALVGRTLNVQIVGTGFLANSATLGVLTVNFGPGITVNTTTRNSATKVTANITITGAASIGTHSFSVANPDGGGADCIDCFFVSAAPSIGTVFPFGIGQGAAHQLIGMSGSGFQAGVKVSIPGGGVTVNSVSRIDDATLLLDVTATGAAATGARNVTVTNPDTGTFTCLSCFIVNAKPTVSTASPSTRPAGDSYTIAVNGTFLDAGASVVFSGTGIQVTSVSGSGTSLSVDITIAANAALGNRSVTVTNPDGGSVTKANVFKVLAAVPGATTTTTTSPPPASTTTTSPPPTTSTTMVA